MDRDMQPEGEGQFAFAHDTAYQATFSGGTVASNEFGFLRRADLIRLL